MVETYEEEPSGHTLESISKLFHTMALEGGLDHTYCIFNTRAFREPMGIPSSIWAELEPAIKERINEIRAGLKAKYESKQSSTSQTQEKPKSYPTSNDKKMPNQYPTMKNKQTVANLVNSLADMTVDDDEDTDVGPIDL